MIRLQFSTESGILSEIIRTFDHGWCSHVDAILPDNTLLGARSDGGVQIRPPNYTKFTRTQIVSIPIDDKPFLEFLHAQVGKPYDSTAIFAFAFDRDWREDDSWFCSELQAAALEKVWFQHKLSTAANRITPSDLLLALSVTLDL